MISCFGAFVMIHTFIPCCKEMKAPVVYHGEKPMVVVTDGRKRVRFGIKQEVGKTKAAFAAS